ncbi:filamentous hemagglutinin N-terminal domain-containing protein [Pigmentiphaga sp. H8]|uniref:MBG domain-containing protein n=1 Tax=Pigmentiphaga sp. H8 TaxID=2488560 RepID=UPI000F593FDC|nr:MBG domain-containing protein [Pigmentiphaga sp. H8]AZG09120.1 filamentous hemagglutinin N-terminal domain-containing protein [Pigmentiphaga sp. H8]
MNHTYRLVWNPSTQRYVPAPETARGRGKSKGRAGRALAVPAVAALGVVLSLPAYAQAPAANALPTGGSVVAGQAGISQSGSRMTIQQGSNRAIIDWTSFNIGSNATVRFEQASSASVALNRVVGGDASRIHGQLTANGQVWLVNPNGVVFGRGSQVNVGGLVASTLGIANEDFLNGKYAFTRGSATGGIVNRGTITAKDGGQIALLAPTVSNDGVLVARLGSVAMAAGDRITLESGVNGLLRVEVEPSTVRTLIENRQLVVADGGQVIMTGKAADALSASVVSNTGTLQARTLQEKDGRILLLADMGNGTVQVGGTLDASAPGGGDGGFIETSGARVRVDAGTAVTTAANHGQTGVWLIDPTDFTISAGSAAQTGSGIGADTLAQALAGSNVTLQTASAGSDAGDIHVNAAVGYDSTSTLSLVADNDIHINAAITATHGGLTLRAGNDIGASAAVQVDTFTLQAGNWRQVGALADFSANDFRLEGGSFVRATGGDGGTANAYRIADAYGLQGIGTLLSSHYTLAGNVDASGTATWNDGKGWDPLGDRDTRFTGSFDGNGHTITGLTVNRGSESYVGLFGVIASGASVRNVGLADARVTGSDSTGALAGENYGSIGRAHATGAVTGRTSVGGLVGYNGVGHIDTSYASVQVNGNGGNAGGLVGDNLGTIRTSYATGDVDGSGDRTGGLVGSNGGAGGISDAYATGNVTGNHVVGGLAGENRGAISNSYAAGTVAGSGGVGGLVGRPEFMSSVSRSYYATTDAAGAAINNGGDSGNGWSGNGQGEGKTHAELMDASTYGGWNAGTTWQVAGGDTVEGYEMRLPTLIGVTRAEDVTSRTLFAGGWGTAADAYGITSWQQLADVGHVLGGGYSFSLNNDLGQDSTGYNLLAGSTANGGLGWDPLGDRDTQFTGNFDGNGHTIAGLAINRGGEAYVGLFGVIASGASVRDVGLVDAQVTGFDSTGALAGENYGSISLAHATGTVAGRTSVGGLVGYNSTGGKIDTAHASVQVSGSGNIGGLVGDNIGTIRTSYATGDVAGQDQVGGLVGVNGAGTIRNAYATGNVTGERYVGGLVGDSIMSTISNTYATGKVTANMFAGGLVGVPDSLGSITHSYYAITDAAGAAINNGGVMDGDWRGNGTGTARTLAELRQADTFASWGAAIDDQGGTGATWRIYDGHTTPLLRDFLRSLTVTADSTGTLASQTYDGSAASQGTGHTASVAGAQVEGSLAYVTHGKDAGTYSTVDDTLLLGGLYSNQQGYDISYDTSTAATLTIDKASIVVSGITAGNKTYDGTTRATVDATGATLAGLVGGDQVTLDASTGIFGDKNAGAGKTVVLSNTYSGEDLRNYVITDQATATADIGKAGLTVTANDASKTYGQTSGLNGYTTRGLVNGDSVSGVALASSGSAATANVGTYAIVASDAAGVGLSNYDITYVDGALAVNKAGLTVTANDASKTYGQTSGLNGYTASGLVNGDNVSSVALASSGSAATANVGNYAIVAGDANGAGLSNYDITYVDGTLTVDKAGLIVTANDAGKIYGQASGLNGYMANGLVNGDSVSGVALASSGSAATANVGDYAIVASNAAGTGLGNYDITYVDGTLTVDKAALTVTANDVSKTYGQTSGLNGYTTRGLVNGDSVSGVALTSSGSAATANVGTYAIVASDAAGVGLSNYDITYVDGALAVNKAGLTVTANDASKTYGQTSGLNGYTASGLVNGDSVSSVALASSGSAATATVGNYAIVAGDANGAGLSNYDITYVDGMLTVDKAGLTITANDASKTYGQTSGLNAYTANGLVNGDSLSGVALTSNGSAATANVGTYAIMASDAAGVGLSNYDITYVDGALTVDKAGLTVTANDASKIYGQTSGLNGYTTSGLVNGDSVSGVALASSGSVATANVGDYAIIARGADGTGLGNYDITYVDGTLAVDKAALTVTANDASKTYGQTSILNGYMASGLVNGDSVSGVALASNGSAATANVGNYAIVASEANGKGLSNYDITYVDGMLAVDKAGLIITATDTSKTYGQTSGLNAYTANGLVNGDSVSGVALASNGIAATANVGTYAIVASDAAGVGLSNYDITYVDGTLTVDKAALTVTANDASKIYGQTSGLGWIQGQWSGQWRQRQWRGVGQQRQRRDSQRG